jgi:glycosyltransferase involved in cell wall biosynthesis
MAIRVLHVFAPSYRTRFSGDIVRWKWLFSHWDAPEVVHLVLDCGSDTLLSPGEAFTFEYPSEQKRTSRRERAAWVLSLSRSLARHKGRYDVLHVHVLWWSTLLAGRWARRQGIPAVYETVLLDADTPGGILSKTLGGMQVRLLRDYKAILAISSYLADDYLQHGFRPDQVTTLMLCVDTEVFSPVRSADEKSSLRRALNLPQQATIVLFVGSVVARKGIDVLIRAFVQIANARPDLYLLLVGPKDSNENPSLDDGFVNGLRSTLSEAALSERVTFAGLVRDRTRLAELYRASDVFAMPSRNEGFANVVLEALACGLPAVLSHLPVLDKVIRHGDNGLFVPIGDVDALSDSMLKLSTDSVLAERLGRNARRYVEQNHSFPAWQNQMVEFYRGLLR